MARRRTDLWIVVLGVALVVAYVAQAAVGLEWPWLVRQQAQDRFAVISGCGLACYLAWQWSLGARRLVDPIGTVLWHKRAGACAPLVLYVHASRLSYGYLVVLGLGYLSVTLAGLLHALVIARARRLFGLWFVVHVATATMLIVVGVYHVVIALAYE